LLLFAVAHLPDAVQAEMTKPRVKIDLRRREKHRKK